MIHMYETYGTLTGTIESENVSAAQAYLTYEHDGELIRMERYLDPWATGVVDALDWYLDGDGHRYKVRAITNRELTADELKLLSEEVSGQNSDGLGEGFEQQDFAWQEDLDCTDCDRVYGNGCGDCGGMISFDWQTNKLEWVKVR